MHIRWMSISENIGIELDEGSNGMWWFPFEENLLLENRTRGTEKPLLYQETMRHCT